MLRKLFSLIVLCCLTQSVIADIATDISDGTKVYLTTENAKNYNVIPEDAAVQLIHAGVDPVTAVITVCKVYLLIPQENDYVTTAAINALPTDADTAPLISLYSTDCGASLLARSVGAEGIGDVDGSGGGVSPN